MILLAILAVLTTPAAIASAQGFVPKPAPDPTTTESSADIAGDTPVQPVETPVLPEPTPPAAPVIVPAPGIGTQTLLIKRVRSQLVRYTKSTHRWQNLLGQRPMRPVNIWALGSLQRATRLLAAWKNRSHQLHIHARHWMKQKVGFYKQQIQHWSAVMDVAPPRRVRALASSGSIEYRFNRMRKHYNKTMVRVRNVPYQSQLSCIHYNPRVGHGEGAWNANTGNSYYGGLQMDYGFMRHYGSYLLRTKGTADHWTPLEQMWVAAKAVPSRGFHPWPNTARMCGLL